ncbi:MAG: hypothetical protein KDA89_15185, partial [Planctomycetaceae bacterium]|nr:hypothetical protein [Planctomycetaceae bacterium]
MLAQFARPAENLWTCSEHRHSIVTIVGELLILPPVPEVTDLRLQWHPQFLRIAVSRTSPVLETDREIRQLRLNLVGLRDETYDLRRAYGRATIRLSIPPQTA